MALRFCYVVLAVTLVFASGCRSRSNYQPACPPAVVAATPAPAPCPQNQIPAPPPPGVLVPR